MSTSIKRLSLAALIPALALGAAGAAHAQKAGAGLKLHAMLSGANEVGQDGQAAAGDADGSGTFTARLVPGTGQLCYTLATTGIDTPTMAHIHSGAAGVNGGVFVGLSNVTAGEHCITVDREKATAIVAKPGDYYVNVHNAAYPAGAVRGQVVKH